MHNSDTRTDDAVMLYLDPSTILDSVVVNPWCGDYDVEMVKEFARKFIPNLEVCQSSLFHKPKNII